MDNQDTDLFFGCLMGLVVFFVVAIAIILATYTPPAPMSTPPIRTTELYTRLVRVCRAIDLTGRADCHSIVYLAMQNRGMMP